MFQRRRAVAACLAVTFLGLCGLFLHAKSITPRSVRIAEIGGGDVGAPVRVQGHVHRVGTTDAGGASLVLVDYRDFATIGVSARPRAIAQPALVAPGALVEVVGSVFEAGRSLQIFADGTDAITVLTPSSSNVLPLEFIARNAARLEGETVRLRADVADLRTIVDPRHARLRAEGAELWAFSASGWTAGQADVTGRLAVTSKGRCELFAAEEPNAVETTLAALAACPDVWLDQPVVVRSVEIVPGELVGTSLTLSDLGDGASYRIAAFVRGWDWRQDPQPLRLGALVSLEGVVEYLATEARWRITAETPPT